MSAVALMAAQMLHRAHGGGAAAGEVQVERAVQLLRRAARFRGSALLLVGHGHAIGQAQAQQARDLGTARQAQRLALGHGGHAGFAGDPLAGRHMAALAPVLPRKLARAAASAARCAAQ